jgi:NAD(P)H-dependent FMN reductase
MSQQVARLLAFSGSARRESFNRKLLAHAIQGAREAGAEVTLVELRDFELPLYDGDLEASGGLPPGATRLRELLPAHQGLLLACPEYNGGVAPLLKNSIDWMTRGPGGKADPSLFPGKVAALCAASPGGLGGMRGLRWVRELLNTLGVTVLADQFTLPAAHKAFDASGALVDPAHTRRVAALGAELAGFAAARGR